MGRVPLMCIKKLMSHRGVSRMLSSNFRFMRVKETLLGRPNFIGQLHARRGTHYGYNRDGCYVTEVCAVSVTYRGRLRRGLPLYLRHRVRGLRGR